jgi:hypothetical protein
MVAVQVKERPILFSGAMIQALLAGTKTQTRRALKPQPTMDPANVKTVNGDYDLGCGLYFVADELGPFAKQADRDLHPWYDDFIRCPYGKPGDRLWVRETHAFFSPEVSLLEGGRYVYRADASPLTEAAVARYSKWKPSIHMPRVASRLLLEVVSIRIEQLRSISVADAVAEGIKAQNGDYYSYDSGRFDSWYTAKESYASLWEHINGPNSWEANPWVWVVEFKVISPASYTIEKTTPETH